MTYSGGERDLGTTTVANRGPNAIEGHRAARGSSRSRTRDRLRETSDYDAQCLLLSPNKSALTKAVSTWFPRIAQGQVVEAKTALHALADRARSAGDTDAAEMAGYLWQMANGLGSATAAIADQNFEDAKQHAAHTASVARMVYGLNGTAAQQIIASAGGLWTAANSAQERASISAANTPMVDQHRLNHERSGAFCGIATLIMVLRASGKNPPTSTRNEIQALAQGIYFAGQGTSGAGMAQRMRAHGIGGATYTTNGTLGQIVGTLQSGQPVPLGVLHSEGEVVGLPGQGSKRYPHLRVGTRHYHKFGASGHWVAVVKFEGSPDKPTAFWVNDPDVGGQLRVTPNELLSMAASNGQNAGMWMVHQ